VWWVAVCVFLFFVASAARADAIEYYYDGDFTLTVTPEQTAQTSLEIPSSLGCPSPFFPYFFLEFQGVVDGTAQTIFTFATTSGSLPHTFEQNVGLPAGDYYWVYLHCATLNSSGEVDWPGGDISLINPINASGTTAYTVPFTIGASVAGGFSNLDGAGSGNVSGLYRPNAGTTYNTQFDWTADRDYEACDVTAKFGTAGNPFGRGSWTSVLTVTNSVSSDVGTATFGAADGDAYTLNETLDTCVEIPSGSVTTFTFAATGGAAPPRGTELYLTAATGTTREYQNGGLVSTFNNQTPNFAFGGAEVDPVISVLPYATSSSMFADTSDLCDHLGTTSTFSFLGTDFGIWFPTGGGVVDCVIDITRYLFVPSQTTLARLTDASTVLQSKAPFGYATIVASSTEAIFEDPGTSSTQVSLTIPAGTMNGHTTQTLALFNTQTVQDNVEPLISPIRAILAILLWAGFLFGLYEFAVHHQKP